MHPRLLVLQECMCARVALAIDALVHFGSANMRPQSILQAHRVAHKFMHRCLRARTHTRAPARGLWKSAPTFPFKLVSPP